MRQRRGSSSSRNMAMPLSWSYEKCPARRACLIQGKAVGASTGLRSIFVTAPLLRPVSVNDRCGFRVDRCARRRGSRLPVRRSGYRAYALIDPARVRAGDHVLIQGSVLLCRYGGHCTDKTALREGVTIAEHSRRPASPAARAMCRQCAAVYMQDPEVREHGR